MLPDYGHSVVQVARGILTNFGVERGGFRIRGEKIVLMVLDGFGWELYKQIRPFKARKIFSVFPTSTSSALVSLETGEVPGVHGSVGYVFPVNGLFVKMPMGRTWEGSPVKRFGLEPVAVPKIWRVLEGAGIKSTLVLPTWLIKDPDGKIGYAGLSDLFYAVHEALEPSSFVYAYWPVPDSMAHLRGPSHPSVLRELELFFENLPEYDATVIITADHGLQDMYEVIEWKEYREKVKFLPFGDPRALWMYGDPEVFENKGCRVMEREEVLEKKMYGEPMMFPERLGDYLVLPPDGVYIEMPEPGEGEELKGAHGGLSPQELYVPLIILE